MRPVAEGRLGFRERNVTDQCERQGSLLDEVARLVRLRRAALEIGWGKTEVLETGDPAVLGLRSEWRGGVVVTLHNLSDRPRRAEVAVGPLRPLTGDKRKLIETGAGIELDPYGYRWFRRDGVRR